MNQYKKFLGRTDLVKNQVEREKLAEQEAASKRKRSIQEQNKQRWLKYQEQLRSELAARYFHSVMSTGGESFNNKYSVAFDGIDAFVEVADADNLSFGNGSTDSPFSISTWVKMTDATKFRILVKSDGTSREYHFYTGGTDKLVFQLFDSSLNFIGRLFDTALTSYQNQWIHLTATYDGSGSNSGLKIYLNGNRVDDVNSSSGSYTAMTNTSMPVHIGRYKADYSNGLIDETAIFNSELSASDVTSIYNGDGTGLPGDLSEFSSLISWWRFEEGSGTTAADSGTGGNNGSIDGATYSTDVPE